MSAASSPAASPERGAARALGLVEQRRVPERDAARGARRSVVVDDAHVEPGQRRARLGGVGDRRAREQELRLAAVERADAPQPAQDERDVRAEHAAIGVRLVDHDVRQVRQHVGPAPVVRQHADVQHVGIREDRIGEAPHEVALLARRVAVVDRRSQAQAVLAQRACLILRERLRRVDVERARRAPLAHRGQHRQREARATCRSPCRSTRTRARRAARPPRRRPGGRRAPRCRCAMRADCTRGSRSPGNGAKAAGRASIQLSKTSAPSSPRPVSRTSSKALMSLRAAARATRAQRAASAAQRRAARSAARWSRRARRAAGSRGSRCRC